jgi:arylsulfatase A-like enzyme
MKRFYVSPQCAPTRASLMTGRYHLRTGVLHTSRGAAKMFDDELTVAELLAGVGYCTGIFGKWHLGDNYTMRAQDQGFQEVLIHKAGAIGQTPDKGATYFNLSSPQ